MRISRKTRLRALFEYEQDEAFLVKASKAPLAAENIKSWKTNFAIELLVATAAFTGITAMTVASAPGIMNAVHTAPGITTLPRINSNLEHVIANEITVYGTPNITNQIASVAEEFPEI